jgi:hypothetical protein
MNATVSKPVEIRSLLTAIQAATEEAADRPALSVG